MGTHIAADILKDKSKNLSVKDMVRYKNSGGDSGILAYETGTDFIKVQFNDGGTYLYTYRSAGSSHIERMKALAVEGYGLNTYINKYTKFKFESRI